MSTSFYTVSRLLTLFATLALLTVLGLQPALRPVHAAPLTMVPATKELVSVVVAGGNHLCALVNNEMPCRGENASGQRGNGTTVTRNMPTLVNWFTNSIMALAAGSNHTCAIVNGGVQCWGDNYQGQLGDGTTTDHSVPVPVRGLVSGVTMVTAGSNHTCALVNGEVRCWGLNGSGQLGDGTTTQRFTPTPVSGLPHGATAIAAGGNHTCAVADGRVLCWGANGYGQLGDGTTITRTMPVQVSGLSSGVTDIIAGGNHTCALVTDSMQCWGANSSGQLGDGTFTQRSIPTPVSGLSSRVTAITAGASTSCVVVKNEVQCWGYGAYESVAGIGFFSRRSTPTLVKGLASGVTALAAGVDHICALVNGGVQCWGDRGNTHAGPAPTPFPINGLASGVTALTAGSNHTCALVNSSLWCWGSNDFGQLGNGTTNTSFFFTPTPVAPFAPFPLSAQLRVEQPFGRPGSDFFMQASNLPLTSTLTIEINGIPLTSSVTTDATGVTSFTLHTNLDAKPGVYLVRVTAPQGSQAETSYQLIVGQPLRTAPADAPSPIVVPAEISALDRLLYTAVVAR